MSNLQNDFLVALEALAPAGITARRKGQHANTGIIWFQDANFQTVLGVSYNFQDGYATFNVTAVTDDEKAAAKLRGTGSKPGEDDITWDGWYASYGKGELAMVRDGVAHLLTTRVDPLSVPNLHVTYGAGAWEFFYDYLAEVAEKLLTVRVTTTTGVTHDGTIAVRGDILGGPQDGPSNPILDITPVPGSDSDNGTVELPLFLADGSCNVVTLHIF